MPGRNRFIIVALTLTCTTSALPQDVYWTENLLGTVDHIRRYNLTSQVVETVREGQVFVPGSVAVDTVHQRVYWIETYTDSLYRANADGMDVQQLFVDIECFGNGVIVDPGSGYVYWTDSCTGIHRCELDGSNPILLIGVPDSESPAGGLALDVAGGKLYWTTTSQRIRRANFDGSGNTVFLSGLAQPGPLSLDPLNLTLYWGEGAGSAGSIKRRSISGGSIETVIVEPDGLLNISVDALGEYVYWTSNIASTIKRVSLGGGTAENLLQLFGPFGVSFDPVGAKVYWTDGWRGQVGRMNRDGSQVELLVTDGLPGPVSIAIDHFSRTMFWTGDGQILRSDLDGLNEEVIVDGLFLPDDIALDHRGSRVYWVDSFTGRVERVRYDGSSRQLLSENASWAPLRIALDLRRGHVYWAEVFDNIFTEVGRIWRANLDGSAPSIVVDDTGGTSYDLEFEPVTRALYWTALGASIRLFKLDTETQLLSMLNVPAPAIRLALDSNAGALYFAEASEPSWLWRTDLSGNNAERLTEIGSSPIELALDVPAVEVPASSVLGIGAGCLGLLILGAMCLRFRVSRWVRSDN